MEHLMGILMRNLRKHDVAESSQCFHVRRVTICDRNGPIAKTEGCCLLQVFGGTWDPSLCE